MMFERKRQQKSDAGSRMDISLALNVRPGVEVELTVSGNTLRARGDGTLNLQINPRSNVFEMYGDYTITEGSFLFSLQNIINKKFVIEDGSTIQWTGSPMDAMLNINAIYKLKASLQPLLQGTSDNLAADRSVPVGASSTSASGFQPGRHLRRACPRHRPRDADRDRQCPHHARDGRYAVRLPVAVQQLHGRNSSSSSNIGTSVSAATGLEFVSNMVSNLLE